jgi:hypothetical protein
MTIKDALMLLADKQPDSPTEVRKILVEGFGEPALAELEAKTLGQAISEITIGDAIEFIAKLREDNDDTGA